MPNTFFRFRQFTIHQDKCAMKVCTDACLFGAWVASVTNNFQHILDIGSGTGLLSLMLAQKITGKIDAVEIEPGAAGQAKENTQASLWGDRIFVHTSSIQSFSAPILYDLIISNPPFFEKDLKAIGKERNIALHSLEMPLAELLESAQRLLAPRGKFAILLPFVRSVHFEEMIIDYGLTVDKKIIVKQTPRHDPFRVMYLLTGTERGGNVERGEIIIKDDNNRYTDQFIYLLKDYYLFENIKMEQ